MKSTNIVNLYHSGDLGDAVYAVPAVRELARPARLTLYPNPGVTRVLMDEANAGLLIPLLNAQPGLSADWRSAVGAGLRLDLAMRRFYKVGYNIADIHSHYVGHEHWPREHPWLTVDRADVQYPVVVARSPRYQSEGFSWPEAYSQLKGRACFLGTRQEHEEFEAQVGPIDYLRTPTLLEAARLIAGADLFVGNQSCLRAVAEGLKVPVLVEAAEYFNNTHFARECAWYPSLPDETFPHPLTPDALEEYWCRAAARRALDRSVHPPSMLEELALLARKVRGLAGDVLEIGVGRGGSAATLAWALRRTIHVCNMVEDAAPDTGTLLDVYHHTTNMPEGTRFVFAHIDAETPAALPLVRNWVLPRMVPKGIIVFNGFSGRDIYEHVSNLGGCTTSDWLTGYPGLLAFQII